MLWAAGVLATLLALIVLSLTACSAGELLKGPSGAESQYLSRVEELWNDLERNINGLDSALQCMRGFDTSELIDICRRAYDTCLAGQRLACPSQRFREIHSLYCSAFECSGIAMKSLANGLYSPLSPQGVGNMDQAMYYIRQAEGYARQADQLVRQLYGR